VLAERDRFFDPAPLRPFVLDTFTRFQQSHQERDDGPVRQCLLPGIRAQHEALLQTMRRRHEKICIEGLHVERLEFVHVWCPEALGAPEITALITFTAEKFFVDDRTGGYRRGLRRQTWFQEFWAFCRRGDAWQLHAIEESHQSDRLHAENRVAGMTDAELRNAQRGVVML
jgi:hypothetical protein